MCGHDGDFSSCYGRGKAFIASIEAGRCDLREEGRTLRVAVIDRSFFYCVKGS